MKWAYSIKNKLKAGVTMTIIMVVIIAGNFLVRNKFSRLDSSVKQLCNDRLKPSAYIFELSSKLYEKKLLLKDSYAGEQLSGRLSEIDDEIESLVSAYDATYLTADEKLKWTDFKRRLRQYNDEEMQLAAADNTVNAQAMLHEFNSLQSMLKALSQIQVGEGVELLRDSNNIVQSSNAISSLEIGMLIVLGVVTLAIIQTPDYSKFKGHANQMWN